MTRLDHFDASAFAVGRAVQAASASLVRELLTLRDDEFVDWPSRAAYSNGWQTYLLRMPKPPGDLVLDHERIRRRLPVTTALIDSLPTVQLCGVSRLLPGCHIFPHRDDPEPGVLRLHLGVRIEPRSGMRSEARTVQWAAGAAFVFDHSQMHEAANEGTSPRDVLLLDFRPTAAELAWVQDQRAAWARRGSP